MLADGVHGGQPAILHIPRFFGFIFIHAGNFDDQMADAPVRTADAGNEIGEIQRVAAALDVRNGKAEKLIFDIRLHARKLFERLGADAFPIRIHRHEIDVAFLRVKRLFHGHAVHVFRAAERVIRVQSRANEFAGVDARIDAAHDVIRHLLRVFEIEQLFIPRIRDVQQPDFLLMPSLDNVFQPVEFLKLGMPVVIGKMQPQQRGGQRIENFLRPFFQNLLHGQDLLLVRKRRRQRRFDGKFRAVNLIMFDPRKIERHLIFAVFHAIADHVRKFDFERRLPFGDGVNRRVMPRRPVLRRRAAFERIERNADDMRVFRRKFPGVDFPAIARGKAVFVVAVQIVIHAAQRPPRDLFAEQLRAERPQPHDMRDRVRVPAFGQHGHRDDAAHVSAQFAGRADRVDDFAEHVAVRQLFRLAVTVQHGIFLFKFGEFGGENLFELVVNLAAVLQRVRINQQRRRFRLQPVILVIVRKQIILPLHDAPLALFILVFIPGDKFIDLF